MRRSVSMLLLLMAAMISNAADLRTLSGKNLDGELVAITDKEIVVGAKDGKRTAVPFPEILQLDLQKAVDLPPNVVFIDVELLDGSLLHCKKVAFAGKNVQVTLLGSDVVQFIPLQTISFILNGAQDAAIRQEWRDKIIGARRTQDQVVIRRDNALNALEGTLGEGNDQGQIDFSIDVGGARRTRSLDLQRVHGLAFVRTAGANVLSSLCKVVDLSQNSCVAARMELADDKLKVFTVSGAVLELPRPSLVRLDFTNDKVAYLSDLTPAGLTYRSQTGRSDPPRMDKNLDGKGPLQIKGEVFSKGMAIHAYTELTYNLDGKYVKFEAVVGMDDVIGGDGQPKVRIDGDGRELFSEVVSRKDARRNLELDVRGIRQLRIVVSAGKPFAFEAHVDLANAKFSK